MRVPSLHGARILGSHKYDAKADLWSVGAILFEMVGGRPPFTGANQLQLLRSIQRAPARLPEGAAAALSAPCRALIAALLRPNPVERISFEEFSGTPSCRSRRWGPLARARPAPPLPPGPPPPAAPYTEFNAVLFVPMPSIETLRFNH